MSRGQPHASGGIARVGYNPGGIVKGGKNIYKGLGNYLNQPKPVPITKQEPRFSELPWSR